MEAQNKFTGKAAIYSEHRPDYPKDYIDYLILFNRLDANNTVADIGSGTGILTRQLLDNNLKVVAVEPNDDMRVTAEQVLRDYSQFTSMNGTAEETRLPDKSVDLITVAQAFHWFDMEKFKLECQRILKQDANVALVWNSRVSSSELIIENAEVCKEYCPLFKGFSGGIDETPDIFEQFFRNGKYDYQLFENPLTFDLDGFLGRNLSASYAPKPTDDHYTGFIQSITELFNKYSNDDVLVMPNLTRSYVGKV